MKDVREAIVRARERLGERGVRTVLFIDEVHRFNKAQQDLLLPATETGEVVLIGATTENPYFEVNAALMSRTTLWRLKPLGEDDLTTLVRRGLSLRGASISDEALAALVATADGDARSALTTLDTAIVLAKMNNETSDESSVQIDDVARARDGRLYHQSADTHYDQISAFIKSVRGSDPDAALYWLVTLLESGESARFIARRLVILASEDVGLADPLGLLVAEVGRARGRVRWPARSAPHPGARDVDARADAQEQFCDPRARRGDGGGSGGRSRRGSRPPARRRPIGRAAKLGHGTEYRYAHDYPGSWVDQQYLPDALVDATFFDPSTNGRERVRSSSNGARGRTAPTRRNRPPPVE